jgi:hypothetical protein
MHIFTRFAGSVALLLFILWLPRVVRAETTFYAPSPLEGELEPDYANAILKFRAGAEDDAIRSLDSLLGKLSGPSAPRDRRRILELQALARSYKGEDSRVRELHEKILAILKEQKAPDAEAAPSLFAIALLDLKAGKRAQARAGLERAHQLGYNLSACHFFLGFIEYKEHELESSARHFRHVIGAPVPAELRALSALYLSRIATIQGRGLVSLRYAHEASVLATDAKVREQARQEFASGALMTGFHEAAGFDFRFDSNSAYLPAGLNPTDSGFNTNDGPTGFGNELDLWLGYVSSPIESWQWSLASRSDILAHWTPDARSADYFDQRLDLILSHHPLDEISFGFKLGLEALWSADDLEPYHLRGNLGAYFRRELRPELVLLAEFTVKPTKNYEDPLVPDVLDRSGPAYDLRVSLFSDTVRSSWNPGLSVWMELNNTNGSEFRSRSFALELSNLYFASDGWKGSLGTAFGVSAYVDRPSKSRYDPFVSLSATTQYSLSSRYSLRGAASFLDDFSSVGAPYRFSRFTLSAGVALQI